MCFRFKDNPPSCGNFTPPVFQRNEFAPAVARQANETAAAGRRPVLLAIGSRSFAPDYEAYPPVLNHSRGVDYRLVLVEPDDWWHPQVNGSFGRWGERFPGLSIPKEKADIVQAAVSARCTESATFYRISRELASRISDRATARWVRRSFGGSSLSKTWLETDLHVNLDKYNIPNLTAYIDEVQVPCLKPSSLLRRVGVDPADIVMVTVDAEGEDTWIVHNLLRIGARPAHIFFERHTQDRPLLEWLHSTGYLVGVHCEEMCASLHGANVAAVRKDYYWPTV